MATAQHVYEVRPRKDRRGVDLVADALPFGGLWYTKPNDAIEYGPVMPGRTEGSK
jgi:hypothetical protein